MSIVVDITHEDSGALLGRIRIENMMTSYDPEFDDYSVQFGVERGVGEVGIHQRGISNFPRTRINVLGLLLQALNTLEEKELSLADEVSSPDLARGLRGIRGKVQGWTDRLYHH